MGKYKFQVDIFIVSMGDAIIIPLAFLAGASSLIPITPLILTYIFILVMLLAILMSAASFFTYKKEFYERETSREERMLKHREFFARLGLPKHIQDLSANDIIQENEDWELNNLTGSQQLVTANSAAMSTAFGSVSGGILALLPYLFQFNFQLIWLVSGSITLPLVFIIALYRYRNDTSWRLAKSLMPVVGAVALSWLTYMIIGSLYHPV